MQFCGTAVLKYCSTSVLKYCSTVVLYDKKLMALSNSLISPKTLRYSNFLVLTEYLNALGALL